jgi:hypothetical protein
MLRRQSLAWSQPTGQDPVSGERRLRVKHSLILRAEVWIVRCPSLR